MTEDILDYLTEDDKIQIAKQVWYDKLAAKFDSDKERIISNAAYHIVSEMCDDVVPNFKEILVEKVKGVITKLSSRTVFDPPDAWNRDPNSGYMMLQEIIRNKRQRIENKVDKIIDELKVTDCNIDIQHEVQQLLTKRLGWTYEE